MSRPVRVDHKPMEAAKRSARTLSLDDAQKQPGHGMSPATRSELERPEPNWKPGWQQEVLARRMGRRTNSQGGDAGMPAVARERLERALCGVLERRYPGLRFAMKGESDARGQGAAPAGDADGLEDGL
jgi:hypothetical protein